MRIPGCQDVHLTYCLNVHPGESVQEVEEAVLGKAAAVFAEVENLSGISGPFGLGLWLSAKAAKALGDSGRLEEFSDRLAEAGLYTFTLNGFPYGRFHGTRVKEAVYRPDWREARRLEYTRRLAQMLAFLLPGGIEGSISTLPVAYRQWADKRSVEAATRNLAEAAAALSHIEETTGKEISLALEPEPDCFLESADDVVGYFTGTLLPKGQRYLCKHYGICRPDAEDVLRRHLGVCLDAVHAAVIFENPVEAIRRLAENEIRVCKVHLGAALKVNADGRDPREALRAFQDDVYLHQVRIRTGDGMSGFSDLPDALAAAAPAGEWRVHYHAPLAWAAGEGVATTSGVVGDEFFRAALSAGVRHFEVETYTLSVFPDQYASRENILARDVVWAAERLRRCG